MKKSISLFVVNNASAFIVLFKFGQLHPDSRGCLWSLITQIITRPWQCLACLFAMSGLCCDLYIIKIWKRYGLWFIKLINAVCVVVWLNEMFHETSQCEVLTKFWFKLWVFWKNIVMWELPFLCGSYVRPAAFFYVLWQRIRRWLLCKVCNVLELKWNAPRERLYINMKKYTLDNLYTCIVLRVILINNILQYTLTSSCPGFLSFTLQLKKCLLPLKIWAYFMYSSLRLTLYMEIRVWALVAWIIGRMTEIN